MFACLTEYRYDQKAISLRGRKGVIELNFPSSPTADDDDGAHHSPPPPPPSSSSSNESCSELFHSTAAAGRTDATKNKPSPPSPSESSASSHSEDEDEDEEDTTFEGRSGTTIGQLWKFQVGFSFSSAALPVTAVACCWLNDWTMTAYVHTYIRTYIVLHTCTSVHTHTLVT